MIINKGYIDGSFEYISQGYIDLVMSSLNYASNTGFTNNNIKEDLISLNHYLFVINEFAKTYGKLIDDVSSELNGNLQAYDNGEVKNLVSSDGLFLLVAIASGYSKAIGSGITDKYIRASYLYIKEIVLNTNVRDSGFLRSNSYLNSTVEILQENNLTLEDFNQEQLQGYVDSVTNACEIVFKYNKTRYLYRDPNY